MWDLLRPRPPSNNFGPSTSANYIGSRLETFDALKLAYLNDRLACQQQWRFILDYWILQGVRQQLIHSHLVGCIRGTLVLTFINGDGPRVG